MTTADVKRWLEKTDIVLLPVGSVEQHGNHMPLGTDIYTAMIVAYGAAEKADVPIAPEVWIGITPYHMHKPGTITVRYHTFANIIYDVCVVSSIMGSTRSWSRQVTATISPPLTRWPGKSATIRAALWS